MWVHSLPRPTFSLAQTAALVFLSLFLALISGTEASTTTVYATPHASYSSSVGVLGCKIDTDRVAYWPGSVDCTNICVSLSYGGRSVYLLRIDESGGAHDVSYDAWNYLLTGYPATQKPTAGGATAMQTENVDVSKCASLIHTTDGKLPLSAANSMDYLASCLAQTGSWVADNYVLYNILDPLCTYGYDETCVLHWPQENQATCPHELGDPVRLTGEPVYNIEYPSGDKVQANALPSTSATPATPSSKAASAATSILGQGGLPIWSTLVSVLGAACLGMWTF